MPRPLKNIKLYPIEIKTIFSLITRLLNEYPTRDIRLLVRINFVSEKGKLICKILIISDRNNNIVRRFELTKDDFLFMRSFISKVKRRSRNQFKSWKKCLYSLFKMFNPDLFDWPTSSNFCALLKYKQFNIEAYIVDIPLPVHFNKFKYIVEFDSPSISIFIFDSLRKQR